VLESDTAAVAVNVWRLLCWSSLSHSSYSALNLNHHLESSLYNSVPAWLLKLLCVEDLELCDAYLYKSNSGVSSSLLQVTFG
jgi:hypothetical protein